MIKRDILKIKRKKQSEQQLMALPHKQTFFQNTPTEKIFFLTKSFKQSCASINCVLSRNILQRIVLQINDLIERYQTISINNFCYESKNKPFGLDRQWQSDNSVNKRQLVFYQLLR